MSLIKAGLPISTTVSIFLLRARFVQRIPERQQQQ